MKNIITFILLLFTSCVHTQVIPEVEKVTSVVVDSSNTNFTIYYPKYDSIRLECFTKITPDVYKDAVFCCSAAFTSDWDTTANHYRICGEHSSNGKLYSNPSLKRNTGVFIYGDKGYKFLYKPEVDREEILLRLYNSTLDNGCGFTQEMMIHNYQVVKTTRSFDNCNYFRALCEYHDELCIIDSKGVTSFGNFIRMLNDLGVKEALYLDMGGWGYSWYRENNVSNPKYIHRYYNNSITNLLVFYK